MCVELRAGGAVDCSLSQRLLCSPETLTLMMMNGRPNSSKQSDILTALFATPTKAFWFQAGGAVEKVLSFC